MDYLPYSHIIKVHSWVIGTLTLKELDFNGCSSEQIEHGMCLSLSIISMFILPWDPYYVVSGEHDWSDRRPFASRHACFWSTIFLDFMNFKYAFVETRVSSPPLISELTSGICSENTCKSEGVVLLTQRLYAWHPLSSRCFCSRRRIFAVILVLEQGSGALKHNEVSF